MWRTVLRLEWRILRRDRAAKAVLGLFAGFLLVSALAGGRHAASLAEGQTRALNTENARVDELARKLSASSTGERPLSARDPRDPVWMGQEGAVRLAVLPPAPLAPIAVGQRDLHPQIVRINTGVDVAAERETETPMSGPTRLMTGAFDPAFLFVVLFPLVVIALSYELLSGEKERGTLAMLLSQPVSQSALVLGKAAARAIALSGVTLVFAVVGLLLAGADLSTPSAWLAFGLYAAVLVAWALFWFAAAVAVNAWGRNSAGNALLLVGLWLVLVVVVPGLVHVVVDAAYPPPSSIELLHEARETSRDVKRELDGLTGTHETAPKKAGRARRVVQVQEELAKRTAPVHKALREQLGHRQSMLDALRFISPAIVVQLALEDVAGSGAVRHARFERQVDDFHAAYRTYFFKLVHEGRHLTTADLNRVPRLTFKEESATALLTRVGIGVLSLLILAGLLIALAYPRLKTVGRLAV